MELEATVTRLAPRVLRYCRAQVASAPLAEEAAQDALAALVERWRRHGPPRSPLAFALAVARRRVVRAAVRARLLEPLTAVPLRLLPAAEPARRAEARSEIARVRRHLARLSRRERRAFLLVVVAELPVQEAAESLGIGESAVKMRVARARRHLQAMREEGP